MTEFTSTRLESLLLRNMTIDSCATWGLHIEQVYGLECDNVTITRWGTSGATGFSGGAYVDASEGQNNDLSSLLHTSSLCHGEGFYSVNGTDVNFVMCDFEDLASARSGSGSGFTLANNTSGFPCNFVGCWFENNAKYGANITASNNTVITFTGCQFPGDSVQSAGVNLSNCAAANFTGCNFLAHTSGYSILNTNAEAVNWSGCYSSDSAGFIKGYTGLTGQNVPVASSVGIGSQYGCIIGSGQAYTLNSAGAQSFPADYGNLMQATLNANCTSSTITNPVTSDDDNNLDSGCKREFHLRMAVQLQIRGWFCASASTTAGYRDSVTFAYDGTAGNWYEISRAVGVH